MSSFTSGTSGSSSNLNEGPKWNLNQIFGREDESKLLVELAEEVSDSHATVVLHGLAGSGKSSLIRSQHWQKKGCLFASGKFDQHRIGEPFSAMVEALSELVDMWVVNNSLAEVCQMGGFRSLLEEDIEFLRNILPKAYLAASQNQCMMDSNNKVFHKKKISSSLIMKQDAGTVDCVNGSFVRILRFLCKAQPVVLFIDDIHWADKASLEVLKVLAGGSAGSVDNLLLVISYRDEEVDEKHPVMTTLKTIKSTAEETKGRIYDIPISDLDVDSVNGLVAAITMHSLEESLPLAEVIHKKTAGNPFFVTQFLLMLRQEHFLHYSFSTFKWEWGDVDKLANAAHVSDNVADVIANSLQSLPDSTRVAIKVASCLGKIVPLNVLVEYFKSYDEAQSGQTCNLVLHQIKMGGLKSFLECAVKRGILIKPEGQDAYMWAHDKLQAVAYSLIPEEFRSSLHVKLGKLLWHMSLNSPDAEWMVFMAADQLNRFSDYQENQVLGADVAALCLEAAELSLSKSALVPAFDMLMAGVQHLCVTDKWTTHHDLSLRLYSTVAELAVQLGKKQEATTAVNEVQTNAKSSEDKFRVQLVMLKCLTSGNDRNYEAGVHETIEILKEYGVKVPTKLLLPGQMFVENQKLRRKLPGKKLESMLDLPEMTDGRSLKIMKLLHSLGIYGMTMKKRTHLGWLSVVRLLNLSAEKGVCEETAAGIASFGMNLRRIGHYDEASEYAELGIRLLSRFPQSVGSLHAGILMKTAGGIFSMTKPFNKALDVFLEAHHIALRTGDTEMAANSILGYIYTYMAVGLPLGPLRSDLVSYEQEARQFSMPQTVEAVFRILHQTILNLQEDVSRPAVLKGDAMDEDKMLHDLEGNGHRMTKRDIYTFRLLLAVFYGYWDMAEILVQELEPFLEDDVMVVRLTIRRTVVALAALRLGRTKHKHKRKLQSMGKTILKDFEREVKRGNVNAYPILLMLQAEHARSKDRYDHAIRACARLGLVHYEAYLCERAAELFLEEQKDEGWAEYYMAQAFVLYEDWGATGKANRLKEAHPGLLKASTMREQANSALKGRSRYTSEHSDLLKEFNWQRLSSMTSSSTSGLRDPTSNGESTRSSSIFGEVPTVSDRSSIIYGPALDVSWE